MERTGLKYGVLTAAGLILYFLAMKVMGLAHLVELRFLNGLIMGVGVSVAIWQFKKSVNGAINYLEGLGVGFITAGIASFLFAVFMVLYVTLLDKQFMQTLLSDHTIGSKITLVPLLVVFGVIILVGVICGFMLAFIAMQFYKRADHTVLEA
ncbi:MAG: DUF4199 domain-containing protein [Hymenobacteraceae bacterium]|nr:DUF4199 domain-containing protein [Hymenobacteraceae bacterium]MDX5396496.1 DUF4199 domain-containing protein [Hymenobacteraceae bacterium]MDX5443919.1 DUF4199 domain-containing protein [Hymenobacteraceae bacterium]MDX5512555.1 DUF4199 domain-containing protein [Hymenobacteraceae bacterium]